LILMPKASTWRCLAQTAFILVAALLWVSLPVNAQQGAATGEPLVVKTKSLPKAYMRREYRFQLMAEGGITPLKWRLESGDLPPGIKLEESGVLHGEPSAIGEFRFTVTVTDSGKPEQELNQQLTLRVVAPLLAEWGSYPTVTGHRIAGTVKLTNGTDQDFDLTFIVLAVNEIGRATAIGYQHFTLKSGTVDLEILFGETLPRGSYQVNADVVGEVAATDTIYRARLVTSKNLEVTLGP
jgi:Putative Ig domain